MEYLGGFMIGGYPANNPFENQQSNEYKNPTDKPDAAPIAAQTNDTTKQKSEPEGQLNVPNGKPVTVTSGNDSPNLDDKAAATMAKIAALKLKMEKAKKSNETVNAQYQQKQAALLAHIGTDKSDINHLKQELVAKEDQINTAKQVIDAEQQNISTEKQDVNTKEQVTVNEEQNVDTKSKVAVLTDANAQVKSLSASTITQSFGKTLVDEKYFALIGGKVTQLNKNNLLTNRKDIIQVDFLNNKWHFKFNADNPEHIKFKQDPNQLVLLQRQFVHPYNPHAPVSFAAPIFLKNADFERELNAHLMKLFPQLAHQLEEEKEDKDAKKKEEHEKEHHVKHHGSHVADRIKAQEKENEKDWESTVDNIRKLEERKNEREQQVLAAERQSAIKFRKSQLEKEEKRIDTVQERNINDIKIRNKQDIADR